jgi:hypothetical protein
VNLGSLLRSNADLHSLEVPGLAENRPSVVLGEPIQAWRSYSLRADASVGDVVYIQREDAADGKWYEGVVREVLQQEVCLRFARAFRGRIPGNQFSVRFGFNRTPMRRQHQALNAPFNEERVFFPVAGHIKASLPGAPLVFKNGVIAANPAQKLAVETIIRLPPGSPPFVVFGPPGTGKVSIFHLLDVAGLTISRPSRLSRRSCSFSRATGTHASSPVRRATQRRISSRSGFSTLESSTRQRSSAPSHRRARRTR